MMTAESKVRDKFLHWMFTEYLAKLGSAVLLNVGELYRRKLAGDEPDRTEWALAEEEACRAAHESVSARDDDLHWVFVSAKYAARSEYRHQSFPLSVRVTDWAEHSDDIPLARKLIDLFSEEGVDISVPNLHQAVANNALRNNALNMETWHTCATTHCRAGWAIVLAGERGRSLEADYGPRLAGCVIYLASTGVIPNFFEGRRAALEDIRQCAEVESRTLSPYAPELDKQPPSTVEEPLNQ